jgi:hypothetical protein
MEEQEIIWKMLMHWSLKVALLILYDLILLFAGPLKFCFFLSEAKAINFHRVVRHSFELINLYLFKQFFIFEGELSFSNTVQSSNAKGSAPEK